MCTQVRDTGGYETSEAQFVRRKERGRPTNAEVVPFDLYLDQRRGCAVRPVPPKLVCVRGPFLLWLRSNREPVDCCMVGVSSSSLGEVEVLAWAFLEHTPWAIWNIYFLHTVHSEVDSERGARDAHM